MSYPQQSSTPLQVIEQRFAELAAPPISLFLSGALLGAGFPNQDIPLDELRLILLKRQTSGAMKDVVWAEVVRRAHERGEPWVTAALGLMMPALLKFARSLRRPRQGDSADIESEIIEGFLCALNAVDPSAPRIYSTLLFTAKRYGFEAQARENKVDMKPLAEEPNTTRYRRNRTGHPDLVLARAVEEETLTTNEADLIGRVRLDGESTSAVADAQGIPPVEVEFRLNSAERRLVRYLHNPPPSAA